MQQNAFVNKISARLCEHTASDKQSQEAASQLIPDYLFNNVVPCANSFGNMHERQFWLSREVPIRTAPILWNIKGRFTSVY